MTQALLSEANKVGLTLEDNVPTINKIKNAVYQANNALPKINEFADKVIYLNNHQDELDNYANKFRDLGKYKDNITDAQDKLNAVNAAVPALNERAKLILALNDYMPNIERLLNVAANDVPNQFPKINKGVNIASQGIDVANDQLTDAQGYLTQAKQRVKDYQDAAGRAQDVNGAVNNDLRNQQSTAQQSANQTHKDAGRSYSNMHTSQVSTNGDASPKGDTVLSDNDVKSMNTALTESLLSLSNQTDKQAQATQQDIKALKNISYGIIASDKPTQFKEPLDNVKSRLENATKYNQQMIDILSELEKVSM